MKSLKPLMFPKMNFDSHFSALDKRDLSYLLNGTIKGQEGNSEVYVQNMLSNELCVNLEGEYCGAIMLDKFEYVVAVKGITSVLYLLNLNTCTKQQIVSSDCLEFDPLHPIRGVYKTLNKTNERVVYWVNGVSSNKYLNIDQALLGNYPQIINGDCHTCGSTTFGELDCNKLRLNKSYKVPCSAVKVKKGGEFPTGTYQIGIAYSEDGILFTDFYFSNVVKGQTYKSDLSFKLSLDCIYSPFSKFTVILVAQTKENGLVVHNFGEYAQGATEITLSSLTNSTILDTSTATQKRVIYDVSQHIVSNDETLLLGKHQAVEPLEYQLQANQIEVEWMEKKVPAKDAHLYPTFLRDEVYDLSGEWQDELGRVRGVFHIPGRPLGMNYNFTIGSGVGLETYYENSDIPPELYVYENLEDCPNLPTKVWQVKNTAYITDSYVGGCESCEEGSITKVGKMGYYECESLTYPDEDRFGALRCQPIRRHKFPSSDLTHIHGNGTCVTETKSEILGFDSNGIPEIRTYTVKRFEPSPCVNVLGVRVRNLAPPVVNGQSMTNWTFRLLYSDRTGNKSILHKGLIYNVNKEVDGDTEIMYPNYPYNDLKEDVYLSKTQTGTVTSPPNYLPADLYYKTRFTYHSPDIHYRETRNEFGTELKLYTEEIGKITARFNEVYRHPKLGIGAAVPDVKTSHPYAQQFDSVAQFEGFVTFQNPLEERRKIDESQWLYPTKQFVSKGERFNNNMRETSYYVELNNTKEVPNPTNEDTSRLTRGDVNCQNTIQPCDETIIGGTTYPIQAVSHYVGIKVPQLNQYGNVEQPNYLPVDACYQNYQATLDFFGGDVYISRHSDFRKMPLFNEWLYDVPYTTEIDYRDKRNVWFPTYWWDNLTQAGDQYRLSCFANDALEEGADFGYIYIWVTGNSYYWCESEFIGNYRESDQSPNSRFYPQTSFSEIAKADFVSLQPTYQYDFSLLNKTIENRRVSGYTKSDANFTVTYSLKNDLQSSGDNWLKFLPLNYTILPQTYGDFTGLHYVDQYSVFFIFENMILYSQEDFTLQSEQGNTIFLGQGDIFSRRLRKISNEKTGYTGSVDPNSFQNTRYGTFYFDRYRKKFFQWSGQLKELVGMNSWLEKFTNNLNPNYLNSIHTVFDNFTNTVFFTDKNNWTLSYSPSTEGFVSFHSFVPEAYLTLPNNYCSILQGLNASVWKHNKKFDYQKYYGITRRFDIGFVEVQQEDTELQSCSIVTDFIKVEDYKKFAYSKQFFDQILVYNNNGSTGILPVFLKDRNDRNQSVTQNKEGQVEITRVKGNTFNFNKLENNHKGLLPNFEMTPNGMDYAAINLENKPPTLRENIKGKWFVIHLRATQNDKIIVQLNEPLNDVIYQQ